MIRFAPDSLVDVLIRPAAMAFPQSNIYVEINAPEIKPILAIVGLAICCAVSWTRVKKTDPVVRAFALLLCLMYVMWICTSGNGRYFVGPVMLIAPLLGVVAEILSGRKVIALALLLMVISFQIYTVFVVNPFESWAQTRWEEAPGFRVEIDERARDENATYISYAEPSFSIAAPFFNHQARWMNLGSIGVERKKFEYEKISRLISSSSLLYLVVPVPPLKLDATDVAKPIISAYIADALAFDKLELIGIEACRFLSSKSLTPSYRIEYTDEMGRKAKISQAGFWLCPLKMNEHLGVPDLKLPKFADSVISAVESKCPRYFPFSSRSVRADNSIIVVRYSESDMVLRLYPEKNVSYQYYSDFEEISLGVADDILNKPDSITCSSIHGRQTLPWLRIR